MANAARKIEPVDKPAPRPQAVQRTPAPRRKRVIPLAVGVGLVLAAVVGGYFVNKYWPYRYRNVKPLFEQTMGGQVTIGNYHRVYFPHPGFEATELTLRRGSTVLGTTHALLVQGSWIDMLLFRRRVGLVDIVGMHLTLPTAGSAKGRQLFPAGSSADFTGPTTIVASLELHDAVLDIEHDDGAPTSFPIRQLIIRNLQSGQPLSYTVDMQNAKPTGDIHATGTFGPIQPKSLGSTPVTGKFTFNDVQLNRIGSLRGVLASHGEFSGTLDSIHASAVSDTPAFAVGDGAQTDLAAQVQCTINGLNGDVHLDHIDAREGETPIHVQGSVAGSPKVTDLDFAVDKGRVQDILHPFLSGKPPIAGPMWLKGHVHVDPGGHGPEFLQRLKVDGVFAVPAERLTDQKTEKTLSGFSERAQGITHSKGDALTVDPNANPAADALTSVDGPVRIRNGILSTSRLTFKIPGASAALNGTFSLHDESVHMHGDLRMETDLSHATTGFKSMLLKPVAPFFRKKHAGAVIPIAITGKPGSYKVALDVVPKK